MNRTNSTRCAPTDGAVMDAWTPVGPCHLIALVLGTSLWSTVLQSSWEDLIESAWTLESGIDLTMLPPFDVAVLLLAFYMVKVAMSWWHPVFKLDVPVMWRRLVIGAVES
jgi:hypothetical protein